MYEGSKMLLSSLAADRVDLLLMYDLNLKSIYVERSMNVEAELAALPGPKVIWMGSEDGAPGGAMAASLPSLRSAERVRQNRSRYQAMGFTYIELDGLDHLGAYLAVDVAAPLIRKALVDSGYR
jgi:hypothetical protein